LSNFVSLYYRLGETMDRMKVKLETMFEASGGRKVDIITHSMGGLVVKSFLALHPEVKDLWF
jgi:triacylglycerol esterase/lipase EstA (alpha/beta hydrolase family)